ncbi:MAG: hypothetical protein IT372_30335 [Polyangiaceae bacterium]|nr:hypothetical protein [Polyangiaceae bacterium]
MDSPYAIVDEETEIDVRLPDNLRNSSPEELVVFALTGNPTGGIADAIEAIVGDLEPLYEALHSQDERWASSAIHQVQNRLRVLAEMARRSEFVNVD